MTKRVVFAWDMHYSCNFHCSYCFYTVAGWEELAKKNTYKTAPEWTDIWKRIFDRYGRCQLRITAGEPFTYPGFVDVIEAVSRFHDMQITSNCSMTETMNNFSMRIDPKRVELDCTFHPLKLDFEIFLKNVLMLKRHGFTANVCYLAHPPQMPRMEDFKRKFKNHGIRMNMAIFWGQYKGKNYPHDYTDEEKSSIKKAIGYETGPETVGLEPIPINGKICGAGQRYAVIQADGRVYRCGQLCHEDKSIGSIFNPEFELLKSGMPCTVDFCRCKEYQSAWEDKDVEALNYSGEVIP